MVKRGCTKGVHLEIRSIPSRAICYTDVQGRGPASSTCPLLGRKHWLERLWAWSVLLVRR